MASTKNFTVIHIGMQEIISFINLSQALILFMTPVFSHQNRVFNFSSIEL